MAREFYCSDELTVVKTTEGLLKGYFLDGIYTFHGIDYAWAERFQQPQPPKSWEGIKDATNYGYICPTMGEPAPSGEVLIPHRFWPANEHCQNLNLWTPTLDPEARKPVMVWLHGGGYANGSSIEQVAYEGDSLAEYGDVVVITVNHRLNILGFLDMSSFGSKYANSVNAGIADLVEALRWIKRNVQAFGGDPDNVTIFGQSGGGGKVETLLQVPEADGLFHKGILMSGLFKGEKKDPAKIGEAHRKLVLGILKELDIPEEKVEELEKVPYDVLERAFNRAQYRLLKDEDLFINWGPVPNEFYMGNPMHVGFTEHAKTVPTMAGSVISEFSTFGPIPDVEMPEEAKKALIQSAYGDQTDKMISLFEKAYPDKDLTTLTVLDAMCRPATIEWAEKKAQDSSAPSYLYLFALNFDVNGSRPAWHCSDIPFVFYNTHRVPNCNIEGVTENLEEEVAGAFVCFARYGNPNHEGMRKWDAYNDQTRATMVFDEETVCRKGDFDRELMAAVEEKVLAAGAKMGDMFKVYFLKQMESGEGGNWMY